MSKGFVYKTLSKKRIADLKAGELSEDSVLKALQAGEFNNTRCEDFRFTSWGTENVHVKNFVWRRGRFRGEFTNCTFSDGKIEEVDFWDSEFKNVTFRNVSFAEGEINSSFYEKYLFELDNVIFENCNFYRFTIGQALNSSIYLNNCRMLESNFYTKSSCITFYKCETQDGESRGRVFVEILEPKDLEPMKVKECLYFGLDLVGDRIEFLNISAKRVNLNMNAKVNIGNLKIYCNTFRLDTVCEFPEQLDEVKRLYEANLPAARILDNIEIICSQAGIFGIIGFKINNLKIAMTEERPKLGSAIFYSQINNLELVGVKTDTLRFDETTVNTATFRSCYFHQLKFIESVIPNLILNSVKIAEKMILNKTKIGHISLERVSIDKKAAWESELSTIAVLDKPASNQKDIRNVSGQRLQTYFDRADVGPLK